MLKVSIKFLCKNPECCTDPSWHGIPLDDVVRWGWEASLEHFSHVGDVVILVESERGKTYLCGNQRWLDHYSEKGKVMPMAEGVELLQRIYPDMTSPVKVTLSVVRDVFDGSMVDTVSQGEVACE